MADGKTNPFGDGNGRPVGGPMGNNFVENPRGNGPRMPAPRSFVEAPPEKRGQKKYDGFELDTASAAPGGLSPLEGVTPTDDKGNPIGTTVNGRSRKPFTLGGG